MTTTDSGRSPDGSGYSAEPEPISVVSAVPVSIPNALPEYGTWLPDVWDAYMRDLVGWEDVDRWARLPATFRWHEFWERLAIAIETRQGGDVQQAPSRSDESAGRQASPRSGRPSSDKERE